ncbi:MAG: hypothetical protein H0U61_10230 [Nocardioidaceae bacterium]|nr:hypothetical protein [Nocardioidaceae bacterium]
MTESTHDPDGAGDPALRPDDDPAQTYVDPELGAHAPPQDRREQPAGPGSEPGQRPGPLKPGETGPDTPDGFASFERPGLDGNWDDSAPND